MTLFVVRYKDRWHCRGKVMATDPHNATLFTDGAEALEVARRLNRLYNFRDEERFEVLELSVVDKLERQTSSELKTVSKSRYSDGGPGRRSGG